MLSLSSMPCLAARQRTLNPKPNTLNPKTKTPNPKPKTLYPRHRSLAQTPRMRLTLMRSGEVERAVRTYLPGTLSQQAMLLYAVRGGCSVSNSCLALWPGLFRESGSGLGLRFKGPEGDRVKRLRGMFKAGKFLLSGGWRFKGL